ncbi:unnamed protein product, partial [Ectocarpus fasciculatus]
RGRGSRNTFSARRRPRKVDGVLGRGQRLNLLLQRYYGRGCVGEAGRVVKHDKRGRRSPSVRSAGGVGVLPR